jgi:hypothetical protein
MKNKDLLRIAKLLDGTEVYIKDPTRQQRERAEAEGVRTYNRAINEGVKFEAEMINVLRERGVWTNQKEDDIIQLQAEMDELLRPIEEGGISIEEAKVNAIRVAEIRSQITGIVSEKISYLQQTVEAKRRNSEFNYLVSECAVYNNDRDKRYFTDYEDYLNQKETVDANIIASKCSEVLYGYPDLDDTPEKNFLKEFKFVDDQFRLINDKGQLVDIDGKLVDEDGNYIKMVGKKKVFVDRDGNEIVPKVRKPFLDKEGNPIAK